MLTIADDLACLILLPPNFFPLSTGNEGGSLGGGVAGQVGGEEVIVSRGARWAADYC